MFAIFSYNKLHQWVFTMRWDSRMYGLSVWSPRWIQGWTQFMRTCVRLYKYPAGLYLLGEVLFTYLYILTNELTKKGENIIWDEMFLKEKEMLLGSYLVRGCLHIIDEHDEHVLITKKIPFCVPWQWQTWPFNNSLPVTHKDVKNWNYKCNPGIYSIHHVYTPGQRLQTGSLWSYRVSLTWDVLCSNISFAPFSMCSAICFECNKTDCNCESTSNWHK